MRKILLLIALFTLLGGANSYATKRYASPSNGTQTWTSGTNTFSWTATSNNFIATGLPTGDISLYTNFHCTVSNFSDNANFIRLVLKNGKDPQITEYINAGDFNVNLVAKYPTWDFTQVTDFLIFGSNSATEDHVIDAEHPASVVITDIYLEKPMSLIWSEDGIAEIDLTDLSASGNFSYNDQTGELTRTEGSGELSINFPAEGVDLSSITGFSVTYTGTNLFGGFKVGISESKKKDFYNNPTGRDDLASHITAEYVGDPSAITLWKWWENSSTGTMTISSIKLKGGVLKANPGGEIAVESLERKYYEGGEWKSGTVNFSYGSGIGTVVGDGNATQDEYIDLSDYTELRMYVSSGDIRIFVVKEDAFTPSADGYIITKDGVKQNGQWGAIQDTEHKLVKNGDYYYITIDDLKEACGGQAKLIGVKAEYGSTVDVSKVIVLEDSEFNYSISGTGGMTSSALSALADATATSYDATGVTGTGVELTTANPNALFVANAGVLSNANNVIVDGTCANLALSDGYPFQAPAAFTATAVSYNRSFTADKMTTVCLPFALTSDEASALGTFYGLSSVDGTVITFSEVAAPVANTPYLVIPTSTTTLSIGGKSIAATPAETKSSASPNIEFIGTLAATEIPASDESNNYYAFNNGVLVRIAENSATLPAFRAYIKATGEKGVKAFTIQFDDATGVNSLPSMDVAASSKFNVQSSTIYNVAGQRMSKLQKGLNIVNGQKVMVK